MKTELLRMEFDIIERLMVHMHPNSLMAALFWLEIAKYRLMRTVGKLILEEIESTKRNIKIINKYLK